MFSIITLLVDKLLRRTNMNLNYDMYLDKFDFLIFVRKIKTREAIRSQGCRLERKKRRFN